MFDALRSLFVDLGKIIFDAISWFFSSFYSFMIESISALINSVLRSMDLPYGVGWLPEFYAYANFFFPLNELLALLSVLFGVWISVLVLKIILKAIPTLW
ncbi:hypothetical protein SDC9_89693 [bioreactor metagenome]|uniref:Uncharacterized protein n=1 Tax=bioreactor metagenome TaxID=1076179 RepID=A0A644ZT00_9ZZZZ